MKRKCGNLKPFQVAAESWDDEKLLEIMQYQFKEHSGPEVQAAQHAYNRVVRREARKRGLL